MKIKGHGIHACLGYNIIGNQKQLMCIALLIKQMSGKSTSVIDPTHCINKALLCLGSNVNHSSEKVLNSLEGQIKINIDPILYRPSAKIHFPRMLQIMSNVVNVNDMLLR
jgi:hypothetical protein